jgi:hypothetical protein
MVVTNLFVAYSLASPGCIYKELFSTKFILFVVTNVFREQPEGRARHLLT